MKLIEIKVKPGYLSNKHTGMQTWIRTNMQDALKVFGEQVKLMKAYDEEYETIVRSQVWLNRIEVNTNIGVLDWCKLLETDAPGPTCALTPMDLVTTRETVKHWEGSKP